MGNVIGQAGAQASGSVISQAGAQASGGATAGVQVGVSSIHSYNLRYISANFFPPYSTRHGKNV